MLGPGAEDLDFSATEFRQRVNGELVNNLGNLANRTLSMIERYRGGIVPTGGVEAMDEQIANTLVRYRSVMDANLLHQGIGAAMEFASFSNAFVETRAPWAQAKDPAQAAELDNTLAALARAVAVLATLLFPVMPVKMGALTGRLGQSEPTPLDGLAGIDLAGRAVSRGDVLFPRPQ